METIQVNGREVEYRTKQGTSRKYVTLNFLSEDELEIILPREHTIDIEALLKRKAHLIERKHSEFLTRQRIIGEQRGSLQKDQLLLFGEFYEVEINRSGKYAIALDDSKIRIHTPESAEAKNLGYEFLRKWIKRELLKTLNEYLREYGREMKAPTNRLYIKNQKTRWASYSRKRRNIHFNIKLAALPKRIIEYIVIHELAHTLQRNHNKKFWFIVEKFCPDYEERRRELKEYSVLIQNNRVWQKMLPES